MDLQKGIEILRSAIRMMPDKPGVYRMIGTDGEYLYIGKAKNLPKRVTSYAKAQGLTYRLQRMISLINSVEFTVTASEAEALLLEANFVREHQPKFNILLKDDKSFPYILLTGDKEYNMLLKYRGKKTAKGEYFGPFPSASSVNKTLDVLQKAFPLRSCSDSVLESRTRPCLEYQIKRCTAPCVEKISKPDYDELVQQTRLFLRGKSADVQKMLADKMQELSADMQYEKAAELRDRIKALSRIQADNKSHSDGVTDADIIALHRIGAASCVQVFFIRNGNNYGNRAYFPSNTEGAADEEIISSFIGQFYQTNLAPKMIYTSSGLNDMDAVEEMLSIKAGYKVEIRKPKRSGAELMRIALLNAKQALENKLTENTAHKKLLEKMAKEFGLAETPKRIEVYDNSHISGTSQIGAMIVVDEEGFDRKSYRKFNMREAAAADDYGMMREMLTRRFKRAQEEGGILPDVALIDGGAGQLSAAKQVLADLGLHGLCLIAIAKGEDRNAGNEEYHMPDLHPFRLQRGSDIAHFMQRIRDEAHRFAITTHRARRSKEIIKSELDQIEGIGAKRKKALLNHFGAVSEVKNASIDSLLKVEGINRKTAEIIYNYFH